MAEEPSIGICSPSSRLSARREPRQLRASSSAARLLKPRDPVPARPVNLTHVVCFEDSLPSRLTVLGAMARGDGET